ncbi:MAG: amino acid ABC transporter substrate-binding protein [Pseudomonadota bacterium]|jgi:general L-amino acid transport system substrate-binding protein|uniref:amino acid ABC transporter substrate-binding protein n=2 Tax=Pseudomonas sp. TaxID=306 RepID=UPI00238A877D|nr:amino acid ABC transporter substrate-binding protein [Pseudomonas sp.]MDP9214531.1 amino acid ABC transporter substrate-binding protein [Pseudomonadota bacterium]MDE1913605.1 amino acid ABC transporter substrate-binding protein [Pseudomonas sp.]MDE2037180.1 amino acid ABC transporter substrate-binding protein [Pseudomonas sp.]MDE2193713.1 amino acid ABC transporter substrate-binding protein [Pseudomonas sp.]MDP9450133.1 amino acid ABC transporter substrate-binding protein [Pseudomonadota ba
MKNENKIFKVGLTVAALTLSSMMSMGAMAGTTLDNVKKKGFVQCGISDGLPGFSYTDPKGNFHGFDVDVCRAVAAALFGDATKVKYTQLTTKERFTALQSGEVDLLSRSTTWTSSRDGAMGIVFAGVAYYDGQGFLVNKKLGVKSAKELDGATFCIQAGTVTELNLADYFRANGLKFTPISFDTSDESFKALESGRCDVLTSDQSQLYGQRLKLAAPDDYIVLPEIISKEPLTTAVRRGDEEWFAVVRWTQIAMLNAEELGVTSKNVGEMAKSTKNPDIARLLGSEGSLGKDLNLPNDWVVKIVSQVGNYGESFDRNLGAGSDMKINRGLNALWNQGGLQYGPPVR